VKHVIVAAVLLLGSLLVVYGLATFLMNAERLR